MRIKIGSKKTSEFIKRHKYFFLILISILMMSLIAWNISYRFDMENNSTSSNLEENQLLEYQLLSLWMIFFVCHIFVLFGMWLHNRFFTFHLDSNITPEMLKNKLQTQNIAEKILTQKEGNVSNVKFRIK